MEFLINTVKPIVLKLNLCSTMTIDTPTHTQFGKLVCYTHLLNFTVAGLTLNFTSFYVLRVVEVNMVRKVVNSIPFNGFGFVRIPNFRDCRIVACILI